MVPGALQRALSWTPGQKGDDDLPPWDLGWTVQSDRSVVVAPNCHPDVLKELWEVAELETNQGASTFRITPASIARALNQGLTLKRIVDRLEQRSGRALPPTVARVVQDEGQRYGRIKVGWALAYVVTDDDALLMELLRNPKLRRLGLRAIAPGVAAVPNDDPEDALQALRRAGYLPILDGESPAPAPLSLPYLKLSGRRGRW